MSRRKKPRPLDLFCLEFTGPTLKPLASGGWSSAQLQVIFFFQPLVITNRKTRVGGNLRWKNTNWTSLCLRGKQSFSLGFFSRLKTGSEYSVPARSLFDLSTGNQRRSTSENPPPRGAWNPLWWNEVIGFTLGNKSKRSLIRTKCRLRGDKTRVGLENRSRLESDIVVSKRRNFGSFEVYRFDDKLNLGALCGIRYGLFMMPVTYWGG